MNTFCYSDPRHFIQMCKMIRSDEDAGVEANIIYLHWGNEYWDEPSDVQIEMAERLCELGADGLSEGIPMLSNGMKPDQQQRASDSCLYSTGNALSNQEHT